MIVQSKNKKQSDEQQFGDTEPMFITTRQFLKNKVILGDRGNRQRIPTILKNNL